MIFKTNRLIIRPLKITDLPGFYDMQGNPKVMKYVFGKNQTEEEAREDLERCINLYKKEGNDFWIWAIELQSSGEFVGTAALIKSDKGEDEIGYRFCEKHWGNGFGTETMSGMIDYCFNQLKFKELYAVAEKENIGSVKILERSMIFQREFYNEEEKCTDREYRLKNPNN